MKRFTDSGRQAIATENWYAALTLGLIIPEICASLEDPGPNKSRRRYIAWTTNWLLPHFTRVLPLGERVFLSAEDFYRARCSIIHSGTAELEEQHRDDLDVIKFHARGSHWARFAVTFNGVKQPTQLVLRVDEFCTTIFDAADEWDKSISADPVIQNEKAKLLVIQ